MATGDTEQGAQPGSEQSPLLGNRASSGDDLDNERSKPEGRTTAIIWTVLAGVFVVALILVFAFPVNDWDDPFPSPESILKSAPVIDGHIGQSILRSPPSTSRFITRLPPCVSSDLPELVRVSYANNVSAFDLNGPMPGHVDIPRLRKGRVGGFFW